MSEQRLKVLALIGNACVAEGFAGRFVKEPVTVAREYFSRTGLAELDLAELNAIAAMDDAAKTALALKFAHVRGEIPCPMPPCPEELVPEEAQALQ